MPGSWADREQEILDKLVARAKTDPQFTAEEEKVLKELIDAFRGWRSFGRFAKLIVITLGMLAASIAAYDAILERIRQWAST
jgi:hypothetical protein